MPRKPNAHLGKTGMAQDSGDAALAGHMSLDSVLEGSIAMCTALLNGLQAEVKANVDKQAPIPLTTINKLDALSGTLQKLSVTQLRVQKSAKDQFRKFTKEQRKEYCARFLLNDIPWKETEDWLVDFRRRHNERVSKETKAGREILGFDPEILRGPKGGRKRHDWQPYGKGMRICVACRARRKRQDGSWMYRKYGSDRWSRKQPACNLE